MLLTSGMKVRVKSEHAMGYIKGRFCSLRGLRQQIDNTIDHERALAWVKTCIVIHTLISIIENGAEDEEFVEELIRLGRQDEIAQAHTGTLGTDTVRESRGQRKRNELKDKLFESGVASL
jgi:hypothetical protein